VERSTLPISSHIVTYTEKYQPLFKHVRTGGGNALTRPTSATANHNST